MKPKAFNYTAYTDLEADLMIAKAELEKVKAERDALKNELCYKCGNYEQAHNGWCDHCRWKEK